ncbi:CKB_collapsed_G0043650.mRNA.1.CDS.1 [Saccharomyces cerevisiae]|nr:CKB_collapsed_G0043650.mRNA.1.CDS.1 [Saccharomyces cerevisiae]
MVEFLGCVLNALLIAGEIYVSAAPVGSPSSAEAFFEYCLSIPIMIVVYFAHRFYRRDWKHFYIKRSEIDLDTGCSVENLELFKAQKEAEKQLIASKPFYYKIYRFWC